MAVLTLENGQQITDIEEIGKELMALNIRLSCWPIENDETKQLLLQSSLNDEEKQNVLKNLDHYFLDLKKSAGYQTRDLIVLSPATPNLDELCQKFDACHTHDDDEVRYIVDGEGIFGFVKPDGTQLELKVEAEEYINVPKDTEHWFYLTHEKRIKAVRYFTDTSGWTPRYTQTTIKIARK